MLLKLIPIIFDHQGYHQSMHKILSIAFFGQSKKNILTTVVLHVWDPYLYSGEDSLTETQITEKQIVKSIINNTQNHYGSKQ